MCLYIETHIQWKMESMQCTMKRMNECYIQGLLQANVQHTHNILVATNVGEPSIFPCESFLQQEAQHTTVAHGKITASHSVTNSSYIGEKKYFSLVFGLWCVYEEYM